MTNEQILQERTVTYSLKQGPRVGDFLRLPHGEYVRFTHIWDEHIQTYYNGSFYLGNGYISYSGSLDHGIKKSDILPTTETKEGGVWFFDKDMQRAGGGVDYKITFRVFEIKEGSDTSGIPQIADYAKKLYRDQAETITRINGNGQPYTLPLPELHIQVINGLHELPLKHIEENTGLKFTPSSYGYTVQPLKASQIVTLFGTYNFSSTYYNNASISNALVLKFNN